MGAIEVVELGEGAVEVGEMAAGLAETNLETRLEKCLVALSNSVDPPSHHQHSRETICNIRICMVSRNLGELNTVARPACS